MTEASAADLPNGSYAIPLPTTTAAAAEDCLTFGSPPLEPSSPLSRQKEQEEAQRKHDATHEATSNVPPLSAVTADLHARVSAFLSETHEPSSLLARVQRQTKIALEVIEEARGRYRLEELSLSYNGGKDCLVMLVLFLSSLHEETRTRTPQAHTHTETQTHNPPGFSSSPLHSSSSSPPRSSQSSSYTHTSSSTAPNPTTIPAIYALPSHPFSSVESFVLSSSQHYHLSLTRYTTDPPHTTLRSAFTSYLSLHPHLRAIFVGTRRTDPHGATLSHFDRTDHGWPDFMRIHPVIDWHYVEIWAFIRHLGVEYCELYDQGYTSLGGTNDTHPNPKLRRKDCAASDGSNKTYRPAYELMDDEEERLGRDS